MQSQHCRPRRLEFPTWFGLRRATVKPPVVGIATVPASRARQGLMRPLGQSEVSAEEARFDLSSSRETRQNSMMTGRCALSYMPLCDRRCPSVVALRDPAKQLEREQEGMTGRKRSHVVGGVALAASPPGTRRRRLERCGGGSRRSRRAQGRPVSKNSRRRSRRNFHGLRCGA